MGGGECEGGRGWVWVGGVYGNECGACCAGGEAASAGAEDFDVALASAFFAVLEESFDEGVDLLGLPGGGR